MLSWKEDGGEGTLRRRVGGVANYNTDTCGGCT
jgi:hypothetical protein